MVVESNPKVARLGIAVVVAKEEQTKVRGIGSSSLRCTAFAISPTATLITAGARTVAGAAVATLRGVFSRSRLSGVHGSMRSCACHFSHTNFFQSEHGTSLIKC